MRILLVALGILAAGLFGLYALDRRDVPAAEGPVVRLAGQEVKVLVADEPRERERGLSGRPELPGGFGMLFVFEEDGEYGFWMKDMFFAIDIIWIAKGGEVVHIERDVTPETYPTSFKPSRPARYVLEVPAGWAKWYGAEVGDSAEILVP